MAETVSALPATREVWRITSQGSLADLRLESEAGRQWATGANTQPSPGNVANTRTQQAHALACEHKRTRNTTTSTRTHVTAYPRPHTSAEPMPALQPGQALVEVRAVGLNFADVFCCLVRGKEEGGRGGNWAGAGLRIREEPEEQAGA